MSFSEGVECNPARPVEKWHRFRLTPRTDTLLQVEVFVGADQFAFLANGADVRIELAGFPREAARGFDEDSWVIASVATLDAILASDLRIQWRRSPLGGDSGQVWVPAHGGQAGAWCGDVNTVLLTFQEAEFSWPWYERAGEAKSGP